MAETRYTEITKTVGLPNFPGAEVTVTLKLPIPTKIPRYEGERRMSVLFAPLSNKIAEMILGIMTLLMIDESAAAVESLRIAEESITDAMRKILQLK